MKDNEKQGEAWKLPLRDEEDIRDGRICDANGEAVCCVLGFGQLFMGKSRAEIDAMVDARGQAIVDAVSRAAEADIVTTFTCSHNNPACGMCSEQIAKLTAERDRFKAALEHYADQTNWSGERECEWHKWHGYHIARAALEGGE